MWQVIYLSCNISRIWAVFVWGGRCMCEIHIHVCVCGYICTCMTYVCVSTRFYTRVFDNIRLHLWVLRVCLWLYKYSSQHSCCHSCNALVFACMGSYYEYSRYTKILSFPYLIMNINANSSACLIIYIYVNVYKCTMPSPYCYIPPNTLCTSKFIIVYCSEYVRDI